MQVLQTIQACLAEKTPHTSHSIMLNQHWMKFHYVRVGLIGELAKPRVVECAVEWALEMHHVVGVSTAMCWSSFEEGTT